MASVSLYCLSAILTQIFTVTNCEFPSETDTNDTESLPKDICESILTNCTCDADFENYALYSMYSIKCNHMADFLNFRAHLTSGEVSKENSAYIINFTDIKYLPPKMLDGLNVHRLNLNATDMSAISRGVFEGVLSLKTFQVWRSKLREIPDFRPINNSIQTIIIDNSLLTALEGHGLQDISEVQTLIFRHNLIKYIDPDVFKGTDNVKFFYVSYNRLTHVPPNLIKPWTKLEHIDLSFNQLLHVNHLFAMGQPEFINLGFNNITDIDSILYPNMNVTALILSHNPLGRTSEHAFNGTIPNIMFLILNSCGIRHFNGNHFEGLNDWITINLDNNPIEEISNPIIRIGYESELKILGSEIVYFSGKIKFKMRPVSTNNLDQMQIIEVFVTRNQLHYLSAEFMHFVRKTSNLELQSNEIKRIDRYSFAKLRNDLHNLDMSNNFITSLNGSVRYLSQLKTLIISDNWFETFEQDEFTGLNQLSEIYLQNNRFKTLLVEQIPTKLAKIYLARNPLQCDCRMYPFLVWFNKSTSTKMDIQLCLPYAVDEDEREINTTCPEMCSCTCAEEGDDVYMSVNCSSRNLSVLPSFLTDVFNRKHNTSNNSSDFRQSLIFEQSTDPFFHIRDRVLGINLENNSLESMKSAQLPVDLIHLHLSNNSLQALSESLLYPLKKLKFVSLSGNPWDCNCNMIGFKKWLMSKLDIVQDVNNTRCRNLELESKIIWTLTNSDLCPVDIWANAFTGFGVLSCILFCLVSMILYTRYNIQIKVYLYSHGVTWVKKKELDHDKQFDAFISFCDKDRDLVDKELISVIEKKDPRVRLCIHYKHFRAGEYIQQNIYNAIQNSKRTVIMLSRDFLESEWCLLEFRTAQSQSIKDKVNRIIVIKVGDLPTDIDPALKTYLESTTYITWGEKHFWNNLLYVLPTSKDSAEVNKKLKQQTESTMKDDTKMKRNVHINNVVFSE